ncbi:MAG: helix-turn-helix transcriptional regulator [Cryomorphaceae bacterium]|nr:helix-turn-helix transcriptional regulator [Cryomorphaceae bacterium]
MDKIVQRIKEIQKTEGLSNAEFADALHVSAGSLSHMYTGRNNPSLSVITRMAERFGVSADYLLFGKVTEGETPKLKSREIQEPEKEIKKEKTDLFTNSPKEAREEKPKTLDSQPEVISRGITSVITTYDDGHFEVYYPKRS